MRQQISDKFYFNTKTGEVSDKAGNVLFKDETIDWIYHPHDHLPLYIVERGTGLTLYNEKGKVMVGAENAKDIEVRRDGSYIVSNHHRHLKKKGVHSKMSYDKELFVNDDVNIEVRTKHFIIQKDIFENEYIFKTIAGEEFATGTGYRLADDKHENPKYIVVQNGLDDTTETLYNRHGHAMKNAENMDDILWSKDAYTTYRDVPQPIVINGRNSMCMTKERFTHKFPEYYGRMIRRCVMGMAVLGGFVGCMIKGEQDKEKFNNTPAVYLGIQNGYATFDTDGNKQTVEVKSQTPIGTEKAEQLNRHKDEIYTVSGWQILMNNSVKLEHQRQRVE